MAIRTVVTRGYGNGTFNGTIGLVVLRGYGAGAAAPDAVEEFVPPLVYSPVRKLVYPVVSQTTKEN